MAVTLPSVYQDGTATVANNGTAVVGQGTLWTKALLPGDFFGCHTGFMVRILSIEDDTHMTLANPYPGAAQTTAHYEVALQSDNARMQETSRQFLQKMQSGNIDALAGLTGLPNTLPMFTAPGAMTLISKADLTNGVAFNVQVPTLADRAPYDGQAAGFTVLVSDVGDGRTALYSKVTATSGDWSTPAYLTGPVGPMPTLEGGTATSLAPTAPPTIDVEPVTGGYVINFGIPRGEGFVYRGAYSGATAYLKDDVVNNAGSSWIALQSTTGNAPPTLPTTSNANWSLVAAAGSGGDMFKSTYDPTNINASAFARANHTGTQDLSTITGFGVYAAKSATYTAVKADNSGDLRFTAAATLNLTAAATLTANWGITVTADGGDVTIDPNGTETINGQATLVVKNGTSCRIKCDGSNFFAVMRTGMWEQVGTGLFILSAASSLIVSAGLADARCIKIGGVLTQSAAGIIVSQFSTDAGATFDTGANYFSQSHFATGTTPGASQLSAATGFIMNGNGAADAASNSSIDTVIYEFDKASAAQGFSKSSPIVGSARYLQNMAVFHLGTTARNALRILNSSGGTLTGALVIEKIRG